MAAGTSCQRHPGNCRLSGTYHRWCKGFHLHKRSRPVRAVAETTGLIHRTGYNQHRAHPPGAAERLGGYNLRYPLGYSRGSIAPDRYTTTHRRTAHQKWYLRRFPPGRCRQCNPPRHPESASHRQERSIPKWQHIRCVCMDSRRRNPLARHLCIARQNIVAQRCTACLSTQYRQTAQPKYKCRPLRCRRYTGYRHRTGE